MTNELLKGDHAEKQNVVPFMKDFNHISPVNLDEILEWLDDNNYLSDSGRTFKTRFWTFFIKQ